MNDTELTELYALSQDAVKYMDMKEYVKAYTALSTVTKKLIHHKNSDDILWKLRVAELVALGVTVPLQMFGLYGVNLVGCPVEIVDLIRSELISLSSGIKATIISSSSDEFVCYKISNN